MVAVDGPLAPVLEELLRVLLLLLLLRGRRERFGLPALPLPVVAAANTHHIHQPEAHALDLHCLVGALLRRGGLALLLGPLRRGLGGHGLPLPDGRPRLRRGPAAPAPAVARAARAPEALPARAVLPSGPVTVPEPGPDARPLAPAGSRSPLAGHPVTVRIVHVGKSGASQICQWSAPGVRKH